MDIKETNKLIMQGLSEFLNFREKSITSRNLLLIMEYGFSKEEAYRIVLAQMIGIDSYENRDIFHSYFDSIVKEQYVEKYLSNAFLKDIRITPKKTKHWELKMDFLEPYEAFVFDDIKTDFMGRILPQIGFFSTRYSYPAVYQDNRLWMSIVPNEINTMKKPIEQATGNVCVMGLGLGYFPYMISLKHDVISITIVEVNEEVIDLFEEEILPQFKFKDKIRIVHMDAFMYYPNLENIDFCFVDLWHDVSDGLPMYLKFRELEATKPNVCFSYWIIESIKCYL